jgi:predicted MFS family arabinose efflux permease
VRSNRAKGLLLSARTAYAIISLNFGSLFLPMAQSLKLDASALGLLTAAYYLGFGVMSLPSGFLATRVDARELAVCGLALASTAALVCGVAQGLLGLVILRLMVGMGLAFFYAPALVLITKAYRRGSEGLATGSAFAAQSLGGMIGIIGWAVLAEVIGWRLSFMIGGVAGLLMSLFILIFVTKSGSYSKGKPMSISAFLSRRLFIVSLVLIGLQVSYGLVISFAVYYLEDALSLAPSVAGLVTSLILAASFFGNPIFGRASDKNTGFRRLLSASGAGAAIGLSMLAVKSLLLAGLGVLVVGFCSGGFAVAYNAAGKLTSVAEGHETLLYSWLLTVSFVGFFRRLLSVLCRLRVARDFGGLRSCMVLQRHVYPHTDSPSFDAVEKPMKLAQLKRVFWRLRCALRGTVPYFNSQTHPRAFDLVEGKLVISKE